MGTSTSRENDQRPNTSLNVDTHRPSASGQSLASRHQSVVLRDQPPVLRHQSEVSHSKPSKPSISSDQPINVVRHNSIVSHPQSTFLSDELSIRQPIVSNHRPLTASHSQMDYELEVVDTDSADYAFVRNALEKCNCKSVLQVFVDNEIDEAAFLLLTEDDLKALLPTKMGPRKKIWELIQELNDASKCAISDDDTISDACSDVLQDPWSSFQLSPTDSGPCDGRDDEMSQPITALAKYSADSFEKPPATFHGCDDESIGSTIEQSLLQPVLNHLNRMTLNVQVINQHHNQYLQSNNFGKDEEVVIQDERHDTKENAMAKKVKERYPVNQTLITAGTKPKSLFDGTQQSKQPASEKVSNPPFKSDRKLPIYHYKKKFLKMVEKHPVVIVIAETGSGKSTQMPQYLAKANYDKKIVCTQPRRLAAKSLAKRVALEYGTKMGQEVGYRVRFDNCTENTTKISYVTEGVLVHELTTDVSASNYSVVIIDEAHERNLNTDVLLGCLKKALLSRPDLKVVISSATVEAKKFTNFFGDAPVLDIPGRSFPVEIIYTGKPDLDYLTTVINSVCRIHQSNTPGDILVFLPGQEEIEHVADATTSRIRDRPNPFLNELVLPLYSKLPSEQQNLIFEPAPPNTRKIILATNIAETSLTIDGIVFVVDSGQVKEAEYVTKANGVECTTLATIPITKAQAKQRSGRAGRTQSGVAYRLYSEETYNNMAEAPKPEILRGNLEMVVLLLFSMGVKNILEFDFLDSPPKDALTTALEKLEEFGAISRSSPFSNEYSITSIGRQMSGFPIEPYLSKMLIMSADLGCSEEMLTIIAILSAQVEKLFKRPRKQQLEADRKKKTFDCPEGDHVTLLKVYNEWLRKSYSHSRAWCKEFFLDWKTLEEAYEIRCQLSTMLDEKKIARKSCGDDMTKVQIAIASGSFRKIAWKKGKYTYFTCSSPADDPVLIHPSSVLFTAKPNVLIYNSIMKTKKAYMNQVLEIEMQYIERYAPSFYAKLSLIMPGSFCDF